MDQGQYLSYLARTYDGQNKIITASRQRLQNLGIDGKPEDQPEIKVMESLKNNIANRMRKEMELFPVWNDWLVNVPGVGPRIGGNLILLFNFKHIPICAKCGEDLDPEFNCSVCGKPAKGDGVLKTRVIKRDFPTISKWWKFMGVHIVDGKKPKKAKGVQCDWSSKGRSIAWLASEGFYFKMNKEHLYKAEILRRIADKEKNRPEIKKGHRLAQAMHETSKLFLAHFWTVHRHLEGKPVSLPYAHTILGHTNIVAPFYYDGEIEYTAIKYTDNLRVIPQLNTRFCCEPSPHLNTVARCESEPLLNT